MKNPFALLAITVTTLLLGVLAAAPIEATQLVFAEQGGLVAFEAEHFAKQEHNTVRAWHRFTPTQRPKIAPDTDGTHVIGASGGAYLEILPDTRWSHGEKYLPGENFSAEPGKMAVLTYRVHFTTPGRYHVWARVYSTGPEDNGLHFGLDGQWPESGRQWQTIKKKTWSWDSRQRTEQVHVGVLGQLFLDVLTVGEHTIQVSMREDGFELDKILLTTDAKYTPQDHGPDSRVVKGSLPLPFPLGENYFEAPALTPIPTQATTTTPGAG